MKKLLYTSMIMLSVCFATAQAFAQTSSDNKDMNTRIKRLLDDYNLYADFSEDGNKVSKRYKEQFEKLFAPNAEVYNDLPGTTNGQFVSVSAYTKEATERFSKGLSTRLKNRKTLRRGNPEFRTDIDSTYTVSVDKDITAFDQQSKTTVKSQNTLFFILGYSIATDELKIITIRKSDKDARIYDELPGGSLVNKMFKSAPIQVSIGFMPALSNIKGKASEINDFYEEDLSGLKQSPSLLGWSANAEVLLSASKKLQLGLGIGLSQYQAKLKLDMLQNNRISITDSDNMEATRQVSIESFTETYKQLFLQVPVFARYALLQQTRLNVFADLGIAGGFKLGSAKNSYSGTFTAYNDYAVPAKPEPDGYAQFNYTLESLFNSVTYAEAHNQHLGLYNNALIENDLTAENSTTVKGLNLMALAGFGASVEVSNTLSLFGAARVYYGLLNIQGTENNETVNYINALNYKSLLRANAKLNTFMGGIELGAIIHLRDSKK